MEETQVRAGRETRRREVDADAYRAREYGGRLDIVEQWRIA